MFEDIAGLSPLAGARAVMREIGERRRADRERETLPKDLSQYVRAAWHVVEPERNQEPDRHRPTAAL